MQGSHNYLGNAPTPIALTESQLGTGVVGARALAQSALSGFALVNGYIEWSVSGNALTAAVKTLNGADPSATDPVYVLFRSPTVGTPSPVMRTLVAACSITLDDTSTMGTANSTAFKLWCVAFDDGGTVRLGLINCLSGTSIYPLAGWGIASSTQETTGADSAHVFYTDGAAVASKAYSVLGYATWESGLATAGTWASAPTREQLWGAGVALPGQRVQFQRTQTGTRATTVSGFTTDSTIPQNTEGTEVMTQAITPTSAAHLMLIAAKVVMSHDNAGASHTGAAIFRDTTANALAATSIVMTGNDYVHAHDLSFMQLAGTSSSTTYKVRCGSDIQSGEFNGHGGAVTHGGVANSYLHAEEIAT
jgi:hypothetical protein